MLLHNPVGVGGWVAGHTQGSESQGKEKIGQDAADDDQHVDPSLQDKSTGQTDTRTHRAVLQGHRVRAAGEWWQRPQRTKHKHTERLRQGHLSRAARITD